MKIADLLAKESIDLQAKVGSKAEALEHLVTLMAKSGKLADEAEYKRCVLAREEEGSTGIGEGIAIPHAKTNAVKAPGLAAMIVAEGVDFASLDDQPAKLFRRCATAKPSAQSRTTGSGRRLSGYPPVFYRDTPAPCSRYRTAATTTVPTASFRMRAAMCALCRSRKPSSRRSSSPRPVCGKLS